MDASAQVELERIVACYVMHDDDVRILEEVLSLPICCWTDFAAKSALVAFDELRKAGENISIITVAHWMRTHKAMDAFECVFAHSSDANILSYRDCVARIGEHGKKRALALVGVQIQERASNPDQTAEELEKWAWAALSAAGDVQVRKSSGLKPISYRSIMHGLAGRLRDQGSQASTRITTPFPELDRITRGFGKSDLVILASRPKMGKSAIAGQIGRHVALYHGPVLEVTLEMDTEELAGRFLAQSTQKPTDEHLESDATEEADSDLPFYFYERGSSLKLLVKRIRKFVLAHPDARMIIVDQLGLVTPDNDGRHNKNRAELVGEITTTLKTLASQLRICILALHQLRRDSEGGNKPPTMESLKDSGKVEEDANMILLLWRRNKNATCAELEVAGNRGGETGKINLEWNGPTVSYRTASSRPKRADPEMRTESPGEVGYKAPLADSHIPWSDVPMTDEDYATLHGVF